MELVIAQGHFMRIQDHSTKHCNEIVHALPSRSCSLSAISGFSDSPPPVLDRYCLPPIPDRYCLTPVPLEFDFKVLDGFSELPLTGNELFLAFLRL